LPDAEGCGVSVICTEVAFEVVQARVAVWPDCIDCGERSRFTVGGGADEPECPEGPPPPPPPQPASRIRVAHKKQKNSQTHVFFISSLLDESICITATCFLPAQKSSDKKKKSAFFIKALYEKTKARQASILDRPF
jgi:hypothetical protein